jgi:hypothetical protein
MTFIFAFALGFLAAAVFDHFAPGVFGQVKMWTAGIVAAVTGFWDKLQGMF